MSTFCVCTVSGDLMLREFQVYFVRSITIMVVDIHLVLVAELCAHKHDQQHTRKKPQHNFPKNWATYEWEMCSTNMYKPLIKQITNVGNDIIDQ